LSEEPPAAEPVARPEPGTVSRLLREIAADGHAVEPSGPPAFAPGDVVGRFRLLRELGRGGFGVVFEAEDTVLPRRVALKAVRTGPRAALRGERLLEEAEAAARLAHPNIVTLHDLGRAEQGPYLVLELLDGEVLQHVLERGPLPPGEAVRIAMGIARGLAHAHARGVAHRDLKPGNVFLTRDGGVKLLDFGLAHAFGVPRAEGGTPAYMAPEQWAGAAEDGRTDVFALGVLLFRLLTGRLPFPGEGGGAGAERAPELELPGLPALGELVGLMLEKDPERRPRDGGEVLRALEAIDAVLRSAGPAAPGITLVPPRPPRRRWPAWAAVAALAAALVAAGLLLPRLRPAEVAPPVERPVIAVADARNETGEPALDALSGLLATSLEQSPRAVVLARPRLIELARRAGAREIARIDEPLAREAGRLAGARLVLGASVTRQGDGYAVEVRGSEPARGEPLFTLRESAEDRDAILPAIDRLSDAVRRALGEPAAEIQGARVEVGRTVTRSLDVYRRYAVARDHVRSFRFAEAAGELAQALDQDPAFALAHLELVRIASTGTLLTEADRKAHLARARALESRLPSKERRLVRAWTARDEGRVGEAVEAFQALARDFPEEVEPALEGGLVLLDADRFEEAGALLERALGLEPANEIAGVLVVRAHAWADHPERGLAAASRARATAPGPRTAVIEAQALQAAGKFPEAVRAAEVGLRGGEDQGLSLLVSASMRAGDFARVEQEATRLLASASPADRARARWWLACADTWRGRRKAALAYLSVPLAGSGYAAFDRLERVALLAGLEAPRALAAAARDLVRADPVMAATLSGDVAGAGAPGVAATLARQLTPGSPASAFHTAVAGWRARRAPTDLDTLRRLAWSSAPGAELAPLFLGEALLEAGRYAEAAEVLARFRRRDGASRFLAWARPRGERALARAELELGRTAEARALLDHLERLWAGADADFPGLAELRALRARAGG